MRIGARNDIHIQCAATLNHFAKRVRISQPSAPVMERYFRRIKGNASTRTEASSIRMNAPKIVEPEG
jgi:hypothetical protein